MPHGAALVHWCRRRISPGCCPLHEPLPHTCDTHLLHPPVAPPVTIFVPQAFVQGAYLNCNTLCHAVPRCATFCHVVPQAFVQEAESARRLSALEARMGDMAAAVTQLGRAVAQATLLQQQQQWGGARLTSADGRQGRAGSRYGAALCYVRRGWMENGVVDVVRGKCQRASVV